MEHQLQRREFLKTAFLGAGLLISEEQIGFAWQRCCTQSRALPVHPDNPSIVLHQDRCRNCGRCQNFCRNVITVFGQTVPHGEDACTHCGQCTLFCSRVISEKYHYPSVAEAINDPDKIVIASTAPAIRVALGEMYGLSPGTDVEGKIVASLKQLGVHDVLDATFSADLTVLEEASELLLRLDENNARSPLPMFTSCCPAWVRFVKLFYPHFLPHLSTTKSPMLIQGALVKTWFAQKTGIDPAKIVHIALAPCTAKKAEILLPAMNSAGISHGNPDMRDVDFALTCRELAYLLNDGKVDFLHMHDEPYSSLMGGGSGAGMIFGNTGGVMEATLRTAYKLLNDKNPPADFFNLTPVRGFDGVRQANVNLGKRAMNVAVVHGTGEARPLLDAIQSGTQKFDFVEVMACTGGCIGGGGQPVNSNMDETMLKQLRLNALYQRDDGKEIRLSCDNPEIKTIYSEFLGKPLGKKSEELLHIDSIHKSHDQVK